MLNKIKLLMQVFCGFILLVENEWWCCPSPEDIPACLCDEQFCDKQKPETSVAKVLVCCHLVNDKDTYCASGMTCVLRIIFYFL